MWGAAGYPGGLLVDDDGSILLGDLLSGTIWRIDKEGGGASAESSPADERVGSLAASGLQTVAGAARAPGGSLVVAEPGANRICVVSPAGTLRVVAGGADGYRDGDGERAAFRRPRGLAVAADGTCYVADTGNDRIRVISPAGDVSTLAGSIYDYRDGEGEAAAFRRPESLALDGGGALLVADTGNNAVRRVTPDGKVTTLAGGPDGGDPHSTGAGVRLSSPTGIALAPDGSVFVADHGNQLLRQIDVSGTSAVRLRFSGPHFPTLVALDGRRRALVVAVASYDTTAPTASLFALPLED